MRRGFALSSGALLSASAVAAMTIGTPVLATASAPKVNGHVRQHLSSTATPIKHLIVVFQENVSFDHYFGTYPVAKNRPGEPSFHAAPGTPTVNGLSHVLLTNNPNGQNPKRLSRRQALTCDQDHDYTNEQLAFDHGAMDRFITNTQSNDCSAPAYGAKDPRLVLDYYDGNTVTGLWNYAQHFSMSDNSYGTTFGPSTPGALNLVSGQTHGALNRATANGGNGHITHHDTYGAVGVDPKTGIGTVINDPDPYFDKCSDPGYDTVQMTGKNIGDLLNARHVTWGWFQGGFGNCAATSAIGQYTVGQQGSGTTTDYSAHHEPFQYYRSTANPNHTPPASVREVGHPGAANHQYDLSWFYKSLHAGSLPQVNFVKAPKAQDGHAGYSDPLDEQHFLVKLTNTIEESKYWKSTAIIVAYDDSDGWYDHQMSPLVNHSQGVHDALTGPGLCGTGGPMLGRYEYRCGYGPRQPLLVISPYAKVNFVDHSITDQTSITRFIRHNWRTGRLRGHSFVAVAGSLRQMFSFAKPAANPLFLNPWTGEPVPRAQARPVK